MRGLDSDSNLSMRTTPRFILSQNLGWIVVIFIIIILSACFTRKAATTNKKVHDAKGPYMGITAIEATFPLKITEINFDDKSKIIHLNDGIIATIDQTVKNYYNSECETDSLNSVREAYINTILLKDSLQTLFLILVKHYPTGAINSKVLFYDNIEKKFVRQVFDFNLHALYEYNNGNLVPTNLKTELDITSPEIDLIDFNHDGVNEYRFKRLVHNGTFNSIQTTILTVKNSSIDTIDSIDTLEFTK